MPKTTIKCLPVAAVSPTVWELLKSIGHAGCQSAGIPLQGSHRHTAAQTQTACLTSVSSARALFRRVAPGPKPEGLRYSPTVRQRTRCLVDVMVVTSNKSDHVA